MIPDNVFYGIISKNPAMLEIFKYIESVAPSSEPLLITGETGVGKELVARAVHRLSGARGPLVTINVAGLDDSMFSDTLFGHSKGAFTGANSSRRGTVERASGGTLFLDEIGDLSPHSQVKLLRLIQEGEYMPLGQDEVKHARVRVITCTNRNLWAMARTENFRKDLNFRLRTHHVDIPPLRERLDDIPLLLNHFIECAANSLKRQKPDYTEELVSLIKSYSFPGNVRELKAAVFDAVSRSDTNTLSYDLFSSKLVERDIDPQVSSSHTEPESVEFPEKLPTIKMAMKLLVEEALSRVGGNQTAAAKMLGISRQALGKRIRIMRESR